MVWPKKHCISFGNSEPQVLKMDGGNALQPAHILNLTMWHRLKAQIYFWQSYKSCLPLMASFFQFLPWDSPGRSSENLFLVR